MLKNANLLKIKEYSLVLGYFISLFSATCFFFDAHKVIFFGFTIQLPIGLIFFPLTFGISNIMQDMFGKTTVNSLVISAFVFDTLLVFAGLFLSSIGDRNDYYTVFQDMPYIMISTWLFLGISSAFNILLYAYLKKRPPKNISTMLIRFFVTITATEVLTSAMSMPLLFYKHGLKGNILLTLLLVVMYKVTANFIITIVYGLFARYKRLKNSQLR